VISSLAIESLGVAAFEAGTTGMAREKDANYCNISISLIDTEKGE